jgi:hypothetical protein
MLVALVQLALPAHPLAAKGIRRVTIRGPGLARPIRVSGTETHSPALRLALFDPTCASLGAVALTPEALGVRYRAVYVMPLSGEAVSIRQDLYPYAQGGPVTYTAGPPAFLEKTAGHQNGWRRGPGELFRLLLDRGLPAVAPASAPSPRSVSAAEVGPLLPVGGGDILDATISGPGLGEPIRVSGTGLDFLEAGGVLGGKCTRLSALQIEPDDLGPRYEAQYLVEFGPGAQLASVEQKLYPFVPGGPVTFTPPGQGTRGSDGAPVELAWGWRQAPGELSEFLAEQGLPTETLAAPVTVPSEERVEPAAAEIAWLIVGLLAGMLTLFALMIRRAVRGPASV